MHEHGFATGVAKLVTWATGIAACFGVIFSSQAHAWGRHDLITALTLRDAALLSIKSKPLEAESIETAAPDLLKRAMPEILAWSDRYHKEHDTRQSWELPPSADKAFGRRVSEREKLLWQLENNIRTPLDFSVTASDREDAPRLQTFGAPGLPHAGTAGDVLTKFAQEPDAQLDNALHESPYIDRLRAAMGLFNDGTAHTHTFRHYYVPHSLIPPLITPRGDAPYRAALYAQLAIGAFRTNHRYWGYRFLAWSLHYAQDVTQPWHTVFVPSLSFLALSKQTIRKKVAGSHYLIEAFSDSWLIRQGENALQTTQTAKAFKIWRDRGKDPWTITKLVEEAAIEAHSTASEYAATAAPLFDPIVEQLGFDLRPRTRNLDLGDVRFDLSKLDFSGDGAGATQFLAPLWDSRFMLKKARAELIRATSERLAAATELGRRIALHVLEQGGEIQAGRDEVVLADPKPTQPQTIVR